MRLVLVLVLAAAAAQAQPVVRTSIDMMPGLEQEDRAKLYRAFYGAQGQVDRINKRLKQIDGELKKKPAAPLATKLRAERSSLQKRIPAIYGGMFKQIREAGLDDAGILRLRRMPRGALREERYNHGVVLEAPGLSDKQRELLTRCIASIDAAQRALHVQQNFLAGAIKDVDKTVKRQFGAAFNNQRAQMEKRFWNVIYYALTPNQMVAVRKLLSPRYAYIPQLEQQIYLLPDVGNSQASRIRSLFVEHQSETTADVAQQRRLGQQLRDRSLPGVKRQELQKLAQLCNARLYKARREFRDTIKAALTEPQLHALRSIAPQMNVGDRYQGLRKAIGEMAPSPLQKGSLELLRKDIQSKQRKIRTDMRGEMGAMSGADFGPESPQQMSMQMMQRRASSKGMDMVRAAGLRAVTEILRPEQVGTWIVAPVLKP